MRFLLFFTPFLLLSVVGVGALASPDKCRQLLVSARSGPGELEAQFDRAPEAVRDFFNDRLGNGLVSPEDWREKFLSQSDSAREALVYFTRLGKKFIHAHELPVRHQAAFRSILNIQEKQMAQISSLQLLDLLNTFAHWNLIPPKTWSQSLQKQLLTRIDSWTPQEFSSLANLRKLSSMPLEPEFQTRLEKVLIDQFDRLPTRTQIELLTGELLNGAHYSIRFWQVTLQTTAKSLRAKKTASNPPKIGPLKDLYRGLLRFRTTQFGAFTPLVGDIETQIELYLNQSGLSLMGGGTSGYINNKKGKIDERLLMFESQLFRIFGVEHVKQEWMDPSIPGMFDPVDYYFSGLNLVVEWDGLHHYLRILDDEGKTSFIPERFILRPLDQAKDVALKRSGLRVYRIAPFMSDPSDEELLKFK